MIIDEKKSKRFAFLISFLFHLILLSCSLPTTELIVTKEKEMLEIPIDMIVVEPEIPKKVEKKTTRHKEKKNIAKIPSIKEKKTEEKPKRLPGDRDNPIVKKSYSIVFPKEALNNNLSGKVKILFHISDKGKAYKYRILKSSGHKVLDQAFIRTVINFYTFNPKRLYGENKKGKLTLTHEF